MECLSTLFALRWHGEISCLAVGILEMHLDNAVFGYLEHF